jgi:colanic acid/amylovoran biosynthesis glycosyltransferase
MHFGYLHTDHPQPSQTFVTDQMATLKSLGHTVQMVSLRLPSHGRAGDDTLYILPPQAGSRHKAALLTRGILQVVRRPSVWCRLPGYLMRLRKGILQTLLMAGYLAQHPVGWDVTVCHFGPVGLMGMLLSDLGVLSAPQITFFHGNDLSMYVRKHGVRAYHPLWRPHHAAVTISHTWRPVMALLGEPAAQVFHLGVNPAYFTYAERQVVPGKPIRFVTTGRLVPKKGQHLVLQALSRLTEDTQWEYHLIGSGPDMEKLKQLAAGLGIAGRVIFHGATPHAKTQELLNASDVFVLPSITAADGDMEGIPVALMEAMASGLPVVSTWHSGIPDLIRHGTDGFLVRENDVEGLTSALQAILHQPGRLPALTRSARTRIEESFDLSHNTAAWAAWAVAWRNGLKVAKAK